MPIHLGGFGEDIDGAGVDDNLAALLDPLLSISGDTLRVPALNRLAMLAAGIASGGTGEAFLVAPSLREIGNFRIAPINGNADADVETDDPPKLADLRTRPLVLQQGENVSVQFNSNTSAAAWQWVLGLFFDELRPIPNGEVRTLRFTSTATLVARVWSNANLTAVEELPAGEYAVIGMRYVGASAIAARLVPRGAGWRPGCIGGDVDGYEDNPIFRYGALGEWMRFRHDEIPSVDFLADLADTDQDIFLDVVKVT